MDSKIKGMLSYAAFVMTYRRSAILEETVKALLAQSVAPSRILIVDNDPEQSARPITQQFPNQNVGYHAVGYNSGPAGAAYWGCKLLYEEGWEWVLWVDDDDPPVFCDTMEQIFEIATVYSAPEHIGILGAVGVKFEGRKAKTIRIPDAQLSGILEVDNIAGNQFPIIHKRVFELGLFPEPKLFFGFEELQFNLRVRNAGLKLLVDGGLLKKMRVKASRLGFKRGFYKRKDFNKIYREYYTCRNLIYILRRNNQHLGLINFTIKSSAKMLMGFRYGFRYGKRNLLYLMSGMLDGWRGKLGQKYLPNN